MKLYPSYQSKNNMDKLSLASTLVLRDGGNNGNTEYGTIIIWSLQSAYFKLNFNLRFLIGDISYTPLWPI